ncbi:MAG: heavy metal sensor histidine kinase [Agitococcus sp.]|jgi:two-component system heavy metal sensor histidine kinase CusS|nr:heavy metal sensor histidine kinase [Agitococcus sp.]
MIFRLPNTIAVRTSLLFTMLAAGVLIVMGLMIRSSVSHHFNELDSALLEGKLELIHHILLDNTAPDDAARIQQLSNSLVGHHDLVVRVDRPAGHTFFAEGHTTIPDQALLKPQFMRSKLAFKLSAWVADGIAYQGFAAQLPTGRNNDVFIVAIGTETTHHQMFLHDFERQLVLVGGSGLLLIALLSWLAARRGLRPVQTMAVVAEGISAQQLQQRLASESVPLELQPLARAFNAMLDRLGDSLQRLSEFSSDLAHELRTPINNLMTQTQVSLAKPRTAQDYQEILYSSLEEYERLARMISDMLFLAKADNGLVVPHHQTVELAAEIDALLEFYDALAAEKSIHLQREGQGVVLGDSLMIRRAFSNLLSNAIRHSHVGGTITISITQEANTRTVQIENTGADIPAEQISRIFDRFYRGDASRQRTDEGAGLGLAITKSIVQAHHGDVSVISGQGKTRFSVKLPIVMVN